RPEERRVDRVVDREQRRPRSGRRADVEADRPREIAQQEIERDAPLRRAERRAEREERPGARVTPEVIGVDAGGEPVGRATTGGVRLADEGGRERARRRAEHVLNTPSPGAG